MTRSRLQRTAMTALASAALLVAGCGDDDEDGGESAGAGDEVAAECANPDPQSLGGDPCVPNTGPANVSDTDGTIYLKTFIYRPDPATVPAGTTVTFLNKDEILHTVTSGKRDAGKIGREFDAELDNEGATFEFTFDEPGTVPYHCTIHPGMDGTIEVE